MPGGCFRLVVTAELWQACDRCRQYQTLTRYPARRLLYASNRKLAGSQRARQPERQLLALRLANQKIDEGINAHRTPQGIPLPIGHAL